MKTVMVDYDLITPGQKYEAISKYLKQQQSWAKVLKFTWLIRTSTSVTQVRDEVLTLIDSNDKLLVTDVTGDAMAWHNLPGDVADWIHNDYRRAA